MGDPVGNDPDHRRTDARRVLSPEQLRLIVITDEALAAPRDLETVVRLALAAGAPAIQLREKHRSVREISAIARTLRELTREAGALFFVNDRADLALAVGADGVHLGPDDLPVAEVRRFVPEGFLIGYSTDDPAEARRAVAAGADYLGCGAVWSTPSKADTGNAIGPEGLSRVAQAVAIPVVGIGGITVALAPTLAETGAAGIAVIGAVMSAEDPAEAVRALLAAVPTR